MPFNETTGFLKGSLKMLEFGGAIFFVIASWAALSVMLVGLGLALRRTVGPFAFNGSEAWSAFWLGWVFTLGFLQVWHLFFPVDARAFASLALLSLVGLLGSLRAIVRLSVAGIRAHPRLMLVFALLTLWLADRALAAPVGDAGVYHLQAIRWNREHPIILGLANLYPYLGYNNASLLWGALLDSGPCAGRGTHLLNSLFLWVWTCRSVWSLGVVMKRGAAASAPRYFEAILLAPLVAHAVTLFELRFSGTDTDTAVAVIWFAVLSKLIELFSTPVVDGVGEPARWRLYDLIWTTALLSVMPILKLNAALTALILLAVVWSVWWRRVVAEGRSVRTLRWPALAAVAIGLSLVGVWSLRSAFLSGYPFFPLGLFRLELPWTLAEETRAYILAIVKKEIVSRELFTRLAPGAYWLKPFLIWQTTRCPEMILLPAALSALALCAMVFRPWRPSAGERRLLLLAIPVLPGLAVWWALSPEPRYIYGLMWGLACLAGAIWARRMAENTAKRRAVLVGIVILALFPLAHRLTAWAFLRDWTHLRETVFVDPGSDAGFHPIPAARLIEKTNRWGMRVSVTADDGLLWNADLPATYLFDPDVRTRLQGDLRSGFVRDTEHP